MSHLLALEGLKRYYGRQLALEVGELRLPPGTVGFLGPNGAGKSTLVKILLGLLPPSEGRASLLGLDSRADSFRIRASVGYVSETECIVPGLSAVEFVSLAGELCGMPRTDALRRAHELLAFLGVEESRYRKLEELSSGVKQRVALAQALVHDPLVLILDEPTNGLDPAGRRAMLDLIRGLAQEFGKSLILSSHLLDDVARVCESVIILDSGRVLAAGRIDVLKRHVRDRWRVRLGGSSRAFVERLRELGASVEETSIAGGEADEFLIGLPPELPSKVFIETAARLAAPSGERDPRPPVLRGLVPAEESLHDVFRRIVESREGAA
jgi:ABC-2 type transport system ATP-binding protein